MPPVYGRCSENMTRWHYEEAHDRCVEFKFSGCRGNKNNFYTQNECIESCQRRSQPETYVTVAPVC